MKEMKTYDLLKVLFDKHAALKINSFAENS